MTLKLIIERLYHNEIFRYLLAGGYNTIFGFLAFSGLYLLFAESLHYLLIATFSHVLAVTNAFLVYRYLVFKSTGNIWHEYLKVYVVYGVSFGLSLILLAMLVEILHLHPIMAQFFVILFTVIISYVGHSRFTFRSGSED